MTDQLPPHSMENEQAVLGCMLLDPNECIPECIAKLPGAEVFYDLRHQVIYAQMVAMYDAREAVDLVTVQQRLKDADELEQVGGLAYLSTLPDSTPSTANLPSYLETVAGLFTQRRSIQILSNCITALYEHDGEPGAVLDKMESEIMRLSQMRQTKTDKTIKDFTREAVTEIEDKFNRDGAIAGIETGFTDLDRTIDGLKASEMIIVAARPSIGKTTLAMNMVEHVALDLGLPVGVFSLEMSGSALVKRMIASRSEVNMMRLAPGIITEQQIQRIQSNAARIAKSNLHIDDRSGLSIMQIRSKARQWVQRYSIKLLVIDYIQLVNAAGTQRHYENRQQEVAIISTGIKTLAKELNIPVIAISQFNRELEKDKNRKPKMSDLRESGQLEQDCDVALLLYPAPQEDDGEQYDDNIVPVNAFIGKGRNVESAKDIKFTFFKQYTQYKQRVDIHPND